MLIGLAQSLLITAHRNFMVPCKHVAIFVMLQTNATVAQLCCFRPILLLHNYAASDQCYCCTIMLLQTNTTVAQLCYTYKNKGLHTDFHAVEVLNCFFKGAHPLSVYTCPAVSEAKSEGFSGSAARRRSILSRTGGRRTDCPISRALLASCTSTVHYIIMT